MTYLARRGRPGCKSSVDLGGCWETIWLGQAIQQDAGHPDVNRGLVRAGEALVALAEAAGVGGQPKVRSTTQGRAARRTLCAPWGAASPPKTEREPLGVREKPGLLTTFAPPLHWAQIPFASCFYRYRGDNLNMSSTGPCSRNDPIANASVLLAAGRGALLASRWPDRLVGTLIAGLFLRFAKAISARGSPPRFPGHPTPVRQWPGRRCAPPGRPPGSSAGHEPATG